MPIDKPTAGYVFQLVDRLRVQLHGRHEKFKATEALRFYEDKIALATEERPTGIEIHLGLLADQCESIKAAILANAARVKFKPHRKGDAADKNSSEREEFWSAYLAANQQALSEFVDSVVSLGYGVLKGAYSPWPVAPRRRPSKETAQDYLDRMKALKKQWGLPLVMLAEHPLTFFEVMGRGNKPVEAIQLSWKPRTEVYAAYGIADEKELQARGAAAVSGYPDPSIQSLPAGIDTMFYCCTIEYWSKDWYQCYVDNALVFEEQNPGVCYFPAVGRSTISRDPDKIGIGVADHLRVNEPTLNRAYTRIFEGIELSVHKRLTVTLDASSPADAYLGADNQPRKYTYKTGEMEALPLGAKPIDLFAGVENVYGAMPAIESLLGLLGEQGVSPLLRKGVPPGAAGSGYRDNSLYLMAKAQFVYIVNAIQRAIADYIRWGEDQIQNRVQQPVYVDDMELAPSDIENWPCTIEVMLDPQLPQNRIAEGQFGADMEGKGYIDMRMMREDYLGIEQPDEIDRRRRLDMAKKLLEPMIVQEAVRRSGIPGFLNPPQQQASGLVGPNGEPISSAPPAPGGPGGVQQLMAGQNGGQGQLTPPGAERAGQQTQPHNTAGSVLPHAA